MKKRFAFQCWNCQKTYTQFRDITDEQTITIGCPYCNATAVVDLKPYRKDKKTTILRGEGNDEPTLGLVLQLPEIIPTQPSP